MAQAPIEAPSPTPPPPTPVVGVVQASDVDTSLPSKLGFADDEAAAPEAVQAAATAVGGLLDTFLDGAQAGAPDLTVLGAAWLDEVAPDTAAALRTGLTTPELLVDVASYTMTVHAEPAPTLVGTTVEVTRRDGSVAAVELVFDVTGETPVLHLAGPAGGTA